MLNDDVISKLAEETVESFGEVEGTFKLELLELAKETIKSEYRKRVLKDLNKVAITRLDNYLSYYELGDEKYRNSVVEFLKDGSTVIENKSVASIYLSYSVFCKENNLRAMSKIQFSKEIQKHTGLSSKTTTVNGRSVRLFVKGTW